jgi:hypothetical protein
MRQHWPVGYDGEAANEDDFRQIYDAYMEEKKVHPVLMPNTVDVEAVQIFLMETFVMLLALPLPAGMKDADVIWPGSGV